MKKKEDKPFGVESWESMINVYKIIQREEGWLRICVKKLKIKNQKEEDEVGTPHPIFTC